LKTGCAVPLCGAALSEQEVSLVPPAGIEPTSTA
jgi:hypothetical protein